MLADHKLVRNLNHLHICWKGNIPGHKQPRRFLECIDDNFLTQVKEEPMKGDPLLNLIPTNKEKLVGVSLGCTNCEMVEFRILREGRKATSRITALAFMKVNSGLFRGSAWRNPRGEGPGEKSGPGQLADFQRLPSANSRMVHPNEQDIKQTWQEACMDEQAAPDKIQPLKEYMQEMQEESGDPRRLKRQCLSMLVAGAGLRSQPVCLVPAAGDKCLYLHQTGCAWDVRSLANLKLDQPASRGALDLGWIIGTQFAFTWRGVQYTWNRLPQGWKHSPTICHGLIQTALEKGEAPEYVQYIDAIIVWDNTAEVVYENGKKIGQIILKAGFAIKQSKVKGPAQEIQFLGIKWQDGHRQIPMDVINKITAVSPLTSKKETQTSLDIVGFWRLHFPNYSLILSPLYQVTWKKNDFKWGSEQ
ncbi:hypothetical protein GRJ2_000409300 [Grus japonensis]|uniref:ribonuclease H n=1 Tax=Grus japonensis TaxID=30415 RepID=A0ABC9W1E3_GRUJA